MRKIKVLHVIKSLGRGGAETLLPETLKVHDQTIFEFHYVYFLPWKDQLVGDLKAAGGQVVCLTARNNLMILLRLGTLMRYVRQNNIELVHAHLPWAGFVSRLLYLFTSKPVVYTEHNKQERYHGVTFLLNRITFNWQSRAVAVSEDVKESIEKNIKPRVWVQTLANGVNTDAFIRNQSEGTKIRERLGLPPNAVLVGTIAVFRFQKRLLEWLEIAKMIIDRNSNCYFVIVGDGPLKADVEDRCRALQLQGRVHLVGLQTNVKPWLSAMDVYLMTSKFEGLPIALLEAMSMGCAIAATDAGGIKEVIRNNVDGLLVPVDHWQELSNLLIRLLQDQTLRVQLAEAARKRVEQNFSVYTMTRSLEAMYLELTAR